MTKTLQDYKDFDGMDASLETSLFEYGLIWKLVDPDTKEYQLIYGVEVDDEGNYISFDYAYMNEKDFMDLIDEEWFNKEAFNEFRGSTEVSFPQDISTVIQYHGIENIFGFSYYPYTIEQ